MPSWEIVVFIVAAVVVGGLTMGGVTLAYFLDKWRVDPEPLPGPAAASGESPQVGSSDRAA